jgi:hypothetical protein
MAEPKPAKKKIVEPEIHDDLTEETAMRSEQGLRTSAENLDSIMKRPS